MKLLSERPYWPIKDGLPANFPPLEGNTEADVAVIGGGVSGALVAWKLVEAGFAVVVLDRREAAHGSTAGSTSLLQYELDEGLHEMAERIGPERAARCYRRLRKSIGEIGGLVRRLGLDCGFERRESLYLASTRADLRFLEREFAARRAAGFAVEWWPRQRLRERTSLPHPAAILSRDAAQADPYRLAYGLLTAVQRRGGRVCDRTRVDAVQWKRDGAILKTDRGYRVTARDVVIATGYEGVDEAPWDLTGLHSTYAFASEPVVARKDPNRADTSRIKPFVVWETRRPYCYLRTTEDGRVIMGGLDEPFRDPVRRDRLVGKKVASLRRIFARWFPDIRLEIATGWAGTFAETADGLPFIGRSRERKHKWLALGYGANGITFSQVAAGMIAAGIAGTKVPDEDIFGFERLDA